MNHGTKVQLLADPNGDLTITNDEGSITVRADGTVVLSTLAPIELAGASMAKLDNVSFPGQEPINPYIVQRVVDFLTKRGKKNP